MRHVEKFVPWFKKAICRRQSKAYLNITTRLMRWEELKGIVMIMSKFHLKTWITLKLQNFCISTKINIHLNSIKFVTT